MNDLQKELDQKKWLDSESAQADTCGTYNYCEGCDKTADDPCATQYNKFNMPKVKKTCKKAVANEEVTEPKATACKKSACKSAATKDTATKPRTRKACAKK